MISTRRLVELTVFVMVVALSVGTAQAGVLTTINFGSDGLDIGTARLPGSGDYCSDPTGENRPCFSDTTRTLAGHGSIERVTLTATLSWSFGELSLYLTHDGVTVFLVNGLSHSLLDGPATVTFDDLAPTPLPQFPGVVSGTFRPDSPLSAFKGLDASGDWTLTVGDWDTGDISRYSGAVLSITTPEPATLLLLAIGFAGIALACRRKDDH